MHQTMICFAIYELIISLIRIQEVKMKRIRIQVANNQPKSWTIDQKFRIRNNGGTYGCLLKKLLKL